MSSQFVNDWAYLVLYIGQSLKQRNLVHFLQKSFTKVRLGNEIKSLLNRKEHLGTDTFEELFCLAIHSWTVWEDQVIKF